MSHPLMLRHDIIFVAFLPIHFSLKHTSEHWSNVSKFPEFFLFSLFSFSTASLAMAFFSDSGRTYPACSKSLCTALL